MVAQRIFYQAEGQGGVEHQQTFYRRGDILVNPQKVPYRLTEQGWTLIPDDEWQKLLKALAGITAR